MNNKTIILFAHGARDPEWVKPLMRIRAGILAREPDYRVELAFLELMSPDLTHCVNTLVAEGCMEMVVVPIFLSRNGHLKRDMPEIIARLRQAHPAISLNMVEPAGESEQVVQAMAAYALSTLS